MKTKEAVLLKPNHVELSRKKLDRKVRLQYLKKKQKTIKSDKKWYEELDKFLLVITFIFGFGGFGFGVGIRCTSEKKLPLYVDSNHTQQSFHLENN